MFACTEVVEQFAEGGLVVLEVPVEEVEVLLLERRREEPHIEGVGAALRVADEIDGDRLPGLDLSQRDRKLDGHALPWRERARQARARELDEPLALQLLENKVRRAIFQTGFFGVRDLQIRSRSANFEFHVPYWLGFFGNGPRATLQAMDAVRRRFEGAKARAVFSDWLMG